MLSVLSVGLAPVAPHHHALRALRRVGGRGGGPHQGLLRAHVAGVLLAAQQICAPGRACLLLLRVHDRHHLLLPRLDPGGRAGPPHRRLPQLRGPLLLVRPPGADHRRRGVPPARFAAATSSASRSPSSCPSSRCGPPKTRGSPGALCRGDFLSFEVPFFLSVLPVRTTEDAGFPRRALP